MDHRASVPVMKAMGIAVAVFVVSVSSALPAEARKGFETTLEPAVEHRLDKGFEGALEIFNVPGISVAILKDSELAYAKGFGYANKSEDVRATADTLYFIGSTTKAFTASLAVILRDKGIVDLDKPISTYLPADVPIPHDPARQTEITLRHLLSHTAGLQRDPPNRKNIKIEGPYDPAVWDAYNIVDLYEALRSTELGSPVGEKWSYSNFGMALAGHVLERAAGQPFEILLKELIFEPLGMNDTTITLSERYESRLAAFYWDIEGNKTEQPRARFGEVAGMGGMTSSARDMAKFAALQLKTGDRKGDPISLASLNEMRDPIVDTGRAFLGTQMHMGLGWWVRSPASTKPSYEHAGEIDGHTSAFWYSPEQGVAAVILCNTANLATLLLQNWLIRILEESSWDESRQQ